MGILSKEALQAQLPKVGDIVHRTPTLHKSLGQCRAAAKCCRGVVTYVHEDHLWYTVRFDGGYSESFKLPEGDVEE